MSSSRREKSERHRRLSQTAPANLEDAPWAQPGRSQLQRPPARGVPRLLLIAIALVAIAALAALWWPAGAAP